MIVYILLKGLMLRLCEKSWDDVKTISKALLKEVFDIPEDKFTEIKKDMVV